MTSHTLGDLVDETLDNLYRAIERPWQTAVGSDGLGTVSDTALTLAIGTDVQVSDLLEIGSELMLVSAKSDDATPVFTVSRGYMSTTKAVAATGATVMKNPPHPRYQVARAVNRWLSGPANAQLPNVTSQVMNRETDLQYIEMPEDTMRVLDVQHMNTLTGRIVDLGAWRFEQFLPASVVTSGKLLRISSAVANDDDIIVKYQMPYEFSDATEAGTVDLPVGASDLPSLWAAAYLVARREISRLELDQIEEWAQEATVARQGSNSRFIRELWGEYYRRLDEVRDIHLIPKHRPYRKMA